MSTYGVTPSGYVAPTSGELLVDIETQQRALIDADFDTAPDSIDGQNNGIFVSALAEAHEAVQQSHNDLDPNSVSTDAGADRLCRLLGLSRLPAKASTVTLSVTLGAGKTLAAGTSFWSPSAPAHKFSTGAEVTNGGGVEAVVEVGATAVQTGPVFVVAGGITAFIAEAGLIACTHTYDTESGRDIETTPELMRRREREVAGIGHTSWPAVQSRLYAVQGVVRARVYENTENTTDVNGIPPGGTEAVVDGGTDVDVAAKLWAEHTGGIRGYGTNSATATDAAGNTQAVRFSRPVEVRAYACIQISSYDQRRWTALDALRSTVASKVAEIIATETRDEHVGLGDDLFAAACSRVAMVDVPGVSSAVANVSLYPVTGVSNAAVNLGLSAGVRTKFKLDSADVKVTFL